MEAAAVPGIAGIGVDLLRLDRIEGVYARHGEKFVRRILGPQEIEKFRLRSQRDPQRGIRFLATRFAAKEAFSKAIGLGMHSPMAWSRMQTLNEPGGKPRVQLSEPLASWYAERFGKAHISVTDETDTVAAFVVVEALNLIPRNLTETN
ncbi:holo-ACP synthase [Pollutimonas harenae]|uniref:Holo-[acyl-carrier-protein] synthase n=1 Tax=Pollutimonas harenae TaxID=657015 RepID=A0A853GYC2_9BURK|nr:holo-ACP synthase [Pollutimonas harenae]NYT85736.1 holo-ACP synthase [Pollutimonas harenae]TEA70804.1 holo-ACP synthase [Pollutimonas harenae]